MVLIITPMKKFLLVLAVFLICNISFSQKMAQINLKDSCIISGGIIEIKHFKKLCKVCLPEAKKINSFVISYPENPPLYMELICKSNRWDPAFLSKKAKPGLTFMIEEINATGKDGKPLNVKPLIIGFR